MKGRSLVGSEGWIGRPRDFFLISFSSDCAEYLGGGAVALPDL